MKWRNDWRFAVFTSASKQLGRISCQEAYSTLQLSCFCPFSLPYPLACFCRCLRASYFARSGSAESLLEKGFRSVSYCGTGFRWRDPTSLREVGPSGTVICLVLKHIITCPRLVHVSRLWRWRQKLFEWSGVSLYFFCPNETFTVCVETRRDARG